MDLLQEKLAAEFPLTDENLAFHNHYFNKALDSSSLPVMPLAITDENSKIYDRYLPVAVEIINPKVMAIDTKDMGDDEYWENQKALIVKTMEESKRQTGRF